MLTIYVCHERGSLAYDKNLIESFQLVFRYQSADDKILPCDYLEEDKTRGIIVLGVNCVSLLFVKFAADIFRSIN
jgi:hypothetical protein